MLVRSLFKSAENVVDRFRIIIEAVTLFFATNVLHLYRRHSFKEASLKLQSGTSIKLKISTSRQLYLLRNFVTSCFMFIVVRPCDA